MGRIQGGCFWSHTTVLMSTITQLQRRLWPTWTTIDQKFPSMDEATMADLGAGNVLLNFRHRNEKTLGRGVARSSDGGLTWSDISYDSALPGPVCQGSLAAIGESVYFSNPAS